MQLYEGKTKARQRNPMAPNVVSLPYSLVKWGLVHSLLPWEKGRALTLAGPRDLRSLSLS